MLLLLAIGLSDLLPAYYYFRHESSLGPTHLALTAAYGLGTVALSLSTGWVLLRGARWLAGWSAPLPSRLAMTATLLLTLAVLRAGVWVFDIGLPGLAIELGIPLPPKFLAIFWFYTGLVVGPLVMAYESSRSRRDTAMRRLAALQRTQREAEQRVAAARLRALQGRVDPQMLSQMLAAVGQAYQNDPEHAERLLDSLIAFLRLSTSRTREQSPTLGQELALAGAYQRLRALARLPSVALNTREAEAAGDAAFPAGALLALLDEAQRAGGPGPLVLQATRGGNRLRVGCRLPAAPSAHALSPARALVEDAGGRFALQADVAGWHVTMELPDGPA